MENFINGIIDGQKFSDSFFVLKRKTLEAYDALEFEINSKKLKDFQPDPRSKGFGSLRSFLSAECDNFEEDYENKEFYDSLKDCFLKKIFDKFRLQLLKIATYRKYFIF